MRTDDLRTKLAEVESDLALLGAKSVLNRGESERWNRTTRQRDKLAAELAQLEERNARVDEITRGLASGEVRMISGVPEYGAEYDRAAVNNAQAGALRSLEENAGSLSTAQMDRCEMLIRDSGPADHSFWARWTEVHGRREYGTAFGKVVASGDAGSASVMMDDAERAAMADSYRLRSERAGGQSETNGAGGYAIPVFIDPSVVLTNQESGNPFLTIVRNVDINTNAWKGVSSAGVSWSFDAEGTEVSDDSLTSIVQPSVTVFTARGFIPYTIEIGEDWPGFQTELAQLLAYGYDELLIDKFSRGSGSGEPRGILTALAASSPTVIVTSMTDGGFGQEDVYACWKALPQKYRRRANWMMNVGVMNAIRQQGTSNVYHASTVNLTAGAIDKLFERDVWESTYFPDLSTTTGSSNRMVLGDFSNYVCARRTGLQVEVVPHLFSTGSNRPTGQRGLFAYARIGGNSISDSAFVMQANI